MSTRAERHQLQQTSKRYHSELDRILEGTFTDLPLPFNRIIDAIDCEPPLATYIATCTDKLPATFDIEKLVDEVLDEDDRAFGPLSPDHDVATAEAYLIVRELAARRTKFHSPAFSGYDDGTGKLGVRFAGFKAEVLMPLIESVTEHLDQLMEGLGPEEEDAPDFDRDAVLSDLLAAVAALPEEQQAYAQLQVEALTSELGQPEPNGRLVDVLIRSLQLIGSPDGALASAATCLQAHLT